MACSTVSQCPLFMSDMKLSTESTVLSEIPLSSCVENKLSYKIGMARLGRYVCVWRAVGVGFDQYI